MQMIIYSYFNEDSGDSIFSCNEMGRLVWILVILTFMILIMMNMALKLLFIPDFWLDIVKLENVKHLKNS